MTGNAKKLGLATSIQRGVLKHKRHDGLWIEYFEDKAFENIRQALDLIKAGDPLWDRRVRRDIDRIVVTLLTGGATAQYASDINACEIDERFVLGELFIPELGASVIVHEATHARLHHLGFAYSDDRRQRMEDLCQNRELAFADSLANGEVIRTSVEHRQSERPDLTDKGFAQRRQMGEREVLRYLQIPEWLIKTVLVLRPIIQGVRRFARRIASTTRRPTA
jgi:hypothetical protein